MKKLPKRLPIFEDINFNQYQDIIKELDDKSKIELDSIALDNKIFIYEAPLKNAIKNHRKQIAQSEESIKKLIEKFVEKLKINSISEYIEYLNNIDDNWVNLLNELADEISKKYDIQQLDIDTHFGGNLRNGNKFKTEPLPDYIGMWLSFEFSIHNSSGEKISDSEIKDIESIIVNSKFYKNYNFEEGYAESWNGEKIYCSMVHDIAGI